MPSEKPSPRLRRMSSRTWFQQPSSSSSPAGVFYLRAGLDSADRSDFLKRQPAKNLPGEATQVQSEARPLHLGDAPAAGAPAAHARRAGSAPPHSPQRGHRRPPLRAHPGRGAGLRRIPAARTHDTPGAPRLGRCSHCSPGSLGPDKEDLRGRRAPEPEPRPRGGGRRGDSRRAARGGRSAHSLPAARRRTRRAPGASSRPARPLARSHRGVAAPSAGLPAPARARLRLEGVPLPTGGPVVVSWAVWSRRVGGDPRGGIREAKLTVTEDRGL